MTMPQEMRKGWISIDAQEIPFNKEVDVFHTERGVLKGCLYFPEQGEWPLFQGDARYSIKNIELWRLSIDRG